MNEQNKTPKKKTTAPKKTASKSGGTAKARSTTRQGNASKKGGKSTARAGSTRQNSTKSRTAPKRTGRIGGRNATPPPKKGLSFGTVLLLLLTIAVFIGLVIFLVPALTPHHAPTSNAPTESTPTEAVGTPSESPLSPTPSQDATPTPTPTPEPSDPSGEEPSKTPTPTPEPTPTPTPEPTPTPTPTPSDTPLPDPYLKAVEEADKKSETVSKGTGSYTVRYYQPAVVLPGNAALESKINEEIGKSLSALLKSIKANYEKNYDPFIMPPMDEEITVSFYQSESTLSLLFHYNILAGNGDHVAEVKSVNLDKNTGAPLTVFDLLKDRGATVNYIIANIDAGEEPDLDIVKREPGNGGVALCHAWYIDQNTMTVLYNGKTVNSANLNLTAVHVLDRTLYTA